ncbi:MAG: hypothetical protein HYZ75_11955 [Elusimicrobia bacterium]|nr:hypothetical protein [Elusimicrobiota bacterium]
MKNFSGAALLLAPLLSAAAAPASAQIDPEHRSLMQLGFDHALDGRGPLAGYAFYYLNAPRRLSPRQTLRLALAPIYADAELGIKEALGARGDLGLGLAGGALADSHSEIRQGRYRRGESFQGNGGRAAVALYQDIPVPGPAPLAGVLRAEVHHARFAGEKGTDPAFVAPKALDEGCLRTGFRLGGQEPVLRPNLAGELSAWYEGRLRAAPGAYGFADDRRIEDDTRLFWGRALLAYNRPSSQARFLANLVGGGSVRPDRFSAYRLGGNLPLAAEFPLSLPGYYHEEVSAGRFVLLGGSYIVPLSRDKTTWTGALTAASALVDYAPGHGQRGKTHTGVGLGAAYLSRSKTWQVLTAYGYGLNAARGHGNGGHTLGLLVQYDFLTVKSPRLQPSRSSEGLRHLRPAGRRR